MITYLKETKQTKKISRSSLVAYQVKDLVLSLLYRSPAVAWVWSLAWELPHAARLSKKEKKEKEKKFESKKISKFSLKMRNIWQCGFAFPHGNDQLKQIVVPISD